MENKQWYHMTVQLAHQGSGRSLDVGIYVWVKDAIEAMDKYKKMRGIKRSKTTNIVPLSLEETQDLEQSILENKLSLIDVKKRWYSNSDAYRW